VVCADYYQTLFRVNIESRATISFPLPNRNRFLESYQGTNVNVNKKCSARGRETDSRDKPLDEIMGISL